MSLCSVPQSGGADRQRGFTLLEVMIALVLLGMLLTVLFAGLRLGASSWDRAEERVRAAADRAQVMDFLQRYLSRAEPVLWQDRAGAVAFAFEGRPDRIGWVTALPAHRGGGGLHWVALEVAPVNGDSALVLRYQLFHPDTLRPGEIDGFELLAEGIEALEVEFFGPAPQHAGEPRWTDSWGAGRTEFPRLVRLRLRDGRGEWPELVIAPRHGLGEQAWVTRTR